MSVVQTGMYGMQVFFLERRVQRRSRRHAAQPGLCEFGTTLGAGMQTICNVWQPVMLLGGLAAPCSHTHTQTTHPIDTRSASTSSGTKKARMPMIVPVMIVATTGLCVRGLILACAHMNKAAAHRRLLGDQFVLCSIA